MGDKLKAAYLLAELNKKIDNDYQKLSDRLHNLELSHNRKKKALVLCLQFINAVERSSSYEMKDVTGEVLIIKPVLVGLLDSLRKIVYDALWSDGRVNFRIVKHKKKGGRQCAQD